MLDCVVADTDGAGFPIFQQFGQCLPALVPDLWNGPVDQVEIEVFQSETLEARVTSLQRRFVSVVAVPQLGRYEHVIAFDSALAEGGANVGFVVVDSCGVDVAISYLQRVFYCFLGYLAWGRLVYSEAEARNHDAIVEPGEWLDCSLHVPPRLSQFHFNFT